MSKTYRTAMGKIVDVDALRLANEGVIAVGNMKTNARGDELGPGGQVVKSRAQIMQDYHKLNTPMITDTPPKSSKPSGKLKTPMVTDEPIAEDDFVDPVPGYVKPRGSFAEAIASDTEVKTELLEPLPSTGSNKTTGVQRI